MLKPDLKALKRKMEEKSCQLSAISLQPDFKIDRMTARQQDSKTT